MSVHFHVSGGVETRFSRFTVKLVRGKKQHLLKLNNPKNNQWFLNAYHVLESVLGIEGRALNKTT